MVVLGQCFKLPVSYLDPKFGLLIRSSLCSFTGNRIRIPNEATKKVDAGIRKGFNLISISILLNALR